MPRGEEQPRGGQPRSADADDDRICSEREYECGSAFRAARGALPAKRRAAQASRPKRPRVDDDDDAPGPAECAEGASSQDSRQSSARSEDDEMWDMRIKIVEFEAEKKVFEAEKKALEFKLMAMEAEMRAMVAEAKIKLLVAAERTVTALEAENRALEARMREMETERAAEAGRTVAAAPEARPQTAPRRTADAGGVRPVLSNTMVNDFFFFFFLLFISFSFSTANRETFSTGRSQPTAVHAYIHIIYIFLVTAGCRALPRKQPRGLLRGVDERGRAAMWLLGPLLGCGPRLSLSPGPR
jgi:hypothetical protein